MISPNRNGSDSLPPFDYEAEAGALACILATPDFRQSGHLLSEISIDYFYDERHRLIYQALAQLKQSLKPLTNVEVSQFLKDRNSLDDAGGLDYLVHLPDCTPSVHNFTTFPLHNFRTSHDDL
jgi:replicative DNA helicase